MEEEEAEFVLVEEGGADLEMDAEGLLDLDDEVLDLDAEGLEVDGFEVNVVVEELVVDLLVVVDGLEVDAGAFDLDEEEALEPEQEEVAEASALCLAVITKSFSVNLKFFPLARGASGFSRIHFASMAWIMPPSITSLSTSSRLEVVVAVAVAAPSSSSAAFFNRDMTSIVLCRPRSCLSVSGQASTSSTSTTSSIMAC